jgi:hypothetical protein
VDAPLNLKAKGDLAELAVAADLRRRGLKVAFPFGEDWDYDLILCRPGGGLERVQVKYARSDGHTVLIRCQSHSLTNGKVRATKRYTRKMIDWLAAYDASTGRCYYVPSELLGDGMSMLTLRLTPARNGQRLRVRMADDFLAV